MSVAGGRSWRLLIAPGIATCLAFAILVALGMWQLERKAWKEDLVAQMNARAFATPLAVEPEARWPDWRPASDEYRRVRLTGEFATSRDIPVHGLAKPGLEAVPGYFLFSPLRLDDGSTILVNRGFVPREWRQSAIAAPLPQGRVTIVGLERASETRGAFVPANDPSRDEWFVRSVDDMAKSAGLTRVAPFYVDADATPNPSGWPKGGQTQLVLKNDHLQYAITWFGLAASLAGVFGVFAWRRLYPEDVEASGSAHRYGERRGAIEG